MIWFARRTVVSFSTWARNTFTFASDHGTARLPHRRATAVIGRTAETCFTEFSFNHSQSRQHVSVRVGGFVLSPVVSFVISVDDYQFASLHLKKEVHNLIYSTSSTKNPWTFQTVPRLDVYSIETVPQVMVQYGPDLSTQRTYGSNEITYSALKEHGAMKWGFAINVDPGLINPMVV